MFTPARFVVVDDNPDHLSAVLDVFRELGAPCLGIVFKPEQGLDARKFEGVRALFVDLHLTDLVATSDSRRHFAIIADLLERNVSGTGGPFVLVVWTEHEHEVEGLRDYLDDPKTFDAEHAYARPLAIVGLPKGRYIDVGNGEPLVGKADALREAVEATVRSMPQLAALLSWEADVQAAAIASALAPILADRIVHQPAPGAASETWQRALTAVDNGRLGPAAAGKVNRMLHLAVPSSETVRPTDWGAVVELPDRWWADDGLHIRFGVTPGELLEDEYKLKAEDDRRKCRPRLIRIGAACDYAQNRAGPLTYLFGLEIPEYLKRGKSPASEWLSPILVVEPDHGPFLLAVNARYPVNTALADAKAWQPVYRLREQLLMHLISHAGSYLARPGIVQL